MTVAFIVIGAALRVRDFPPPGSRRPDLTVTIYPGWLWVLVGVVAYKHWEPSVGMGGAYGGNIIEVKALAIVIGVVGVATAVAAIWVLVVNGDLPHAASVPVRVLSCTAGLLVAVTLPVSQAAASTDMRDITSIGALGLTYAGPWAVTDALAGWLTRPAAAAALGTVALGCCLGLNGPQMTDLVFADPKPAFVSVLVLTIMVFVAVLVRGHPQERGGADDGGPGGQGP